MHVKKIEAMRFGEVGYIDTRAIYWLAYWNGYWIKKDTDVYPDERSTARTIVKRFSNGWLISIPSDQQAQLMPIPDPPDMFVKGQAYTIAQILKQAREYLARPR